MAVWLVRAGKHGEFEQKFILDKRVYVTWDQLNVNLKAVDRDGLNTALSERNPDAKPNGIRNWVRQIWPFAHDMQQGDLVVMPLKSQAVIYIGKITGDYKFEPAGPDPFFHWRSVEWIGESVPRSNFGQDLLYTFGAFMTICRVQRNNAEARIKAMLTTGWKPEVMSAITKDPSAQNEGPEASDLEQLGRDAIARLIAARFKGHSLTRLVDALLRAQGYTTYMSPEGRDGGVDILAGSGPLGFGSPRLCVEVKSEASSIDRPTVDKLLGAVTKYNANEALFVSWSDFKGNVQKELASSFFRVRLWGQKELLEQLFKYYEQLDEDIRAELPLKRIWTVADQDDETE